MTKSFEDFSVKILPGFSLRKYMTLESSIFRNYNFITDLNLENRFSNNNQWLMNGMILPVSKCYFSIKLQRLISSKRLRRCRLHFLLCSKRSLVEVAGVEPASEIKIQRTSTYIVCFILTLSYQTDKDHLKSARC